jgi:hypothetical protein
MLSSDLREASMSGNSRDWSALASHNERIVAAAGAQPGPDSRSVSHHPARPAAAPAFRLRGRLRLRKRAGRTGTAARA